MEVKEMKAKAIDNAFKHDPGMTNTRRSLRIINHLFDIDKLEQARRIPEKGKFATLGKTEREQSLPVLKEPDPDFNKMQKNLHIQLY